MGLDVKNFYAQSLRYHFVKILIAVEFCCVICMIYADTMKKHMYVSKMKEY